MELLNKQCSIVLTGTFYTYIHTYMYVLCLGVGPRLVYVIMLHGFHLYSQSPFLAKNHGL